MNSLEVSQAQISSMENSDTILKTSDHFSFKPKDPRHSQQLDQVQTSDDLNMEIEPNVIDMHQPAQA